MQMAKIIECASLCCEPGGRDSMLGTLEGESFVLESMNPNRRATPRVKQDERRRGSGWGQDGPSLAGG